MEALYNMLLVKHDKMARSNAARALADQVFEEQLLAAVIDGIPPDRSS